MTHDTYHTDNHTWPLGPGYERTGAERIDAIGGNPHAEETPALPLVVLWREKPQEWATELAGSADDAYPALVALLDSIDVDSDIGGDLVRVLACVASVLQYRIRNDSRFILFGPIVVPTSPRGLDVLRALRTHAEDRVTTLGALRDTVESGSALDVLFGALESARREGTSGILDQVRNESDSGSNLRGSGFRIALDLHSRALGTMPSGTTLPRPILTPELVGREVSGEDALEIREQSDMCYSGTADFLRQFGIDHDTEGGTYDCGECGHESGEEDSKEITRIDDFTLTADMVEALESQNYADAFREHFGDTDGDAWDALLSSCDDAEIHERASVCEDGIIYDSSVWRFVPDFEGIDGLDSLEWSQQARALPLLVAIAQAHANEHTLPPIDGTLEYVSAGWERNSRPRSFAWNHEKGTFSHTLGSGLVLRVDARSGAAALVLRRSSECARIVTLVAHGGTWIVDAPAHEGGEHAATLLGIHKGSAGI